MLSFLTAAVALATIGPGIGWSEPALVREERRDSQNPLQWSSWSPQHGGYAAQSDSRPPPSPAQQSSRLEFGEAPPERDEKTESILRLVTLSYTGARVLRKVEERNANVYLNKYRRYYWLGDRYFHNDPQAMRGSRETCIFPVGPRDNLSYTDDVPIRQILFQCLKFDKLCCSLDCCDNPSATRLRDPDYGGAGIFDGALSQAPSVVAVLIGLAFAIFGRLR